MKHLSPEQLVMLYYGEEERAEERAHLAQCETCAAAFREIESTLGEVEMPVPERPDEFERDLWRRIEPRLEQPRRSFWQWFAVPRNWVAAGAMAALLVTAFLAGRFWRNGGTAPQPIAQQTRERILLVAVGDHLERSQMVLLELVNARPEAGGLDISEEKQRARELVSSNRLYRQTAERTGDAGVATVLDDLERVLIEIAHSPAKMQASDLEQLRRRVEEQGLLFRVKVIDLKVRRETGRVL